MKVNGPGQPPTAGASGPAGVGDSDEVRKAAEARRGGEPEKAFAEKLAGPRPAHAAEPAAITRPGDIRVNDLVAELQAGKLTPAAAIEKVLDRVVERQVGPQAVPAVRDQVRAALQDALENDPLLAAKLRALE